MTDLRIVSVDYDKAKLAISLANRFLLTNLNAANLDDYRATALVLDDIRTQVLSQPPTTVNTPPWNAP